VTSPITYHSTNRALSSEPDSASFNFQDALFLGLAPDGGLFMPDRIPSLTGDELLALRGRTYPEIAHAVIGKFLGDEIGTPALREIVEDAFDFDVPIEPLGPPEDNAYLLRLDRGPTASFKDFAARFMARMMSHWRPAGREITVLVATSGDTGSAVGEAYRGLDGFRVVILYPENEVSPGQKQQLESIGENVRTLAIDGKFDDCQELVKRAFTDADLSALGLTSANSINVGRLLPQIVYYFYAWLHVVDGFAPAVFSVPSGNFGNSLGCELARRMGLPVERIILAVNENDEFPVFLETGRYRKVEPSRVCLSNAMNVGNPSNLARFFDLYGGALTREGRVVKQPGIESMRRHLFSTSVSDPDTIETIKDAHERHGICLEPHGAVGVKALERYRQSGSGTPAVCLETAHPGKFPEVLEDILNVQVDPPESFHRYAGRERRVDRLGNEYESFKRYLKSL
jgi:threonine synthase